MRRHTHRRRYLAYSTDIFAEDDDEEEEWAEGSTVGRRRLRMKCLSCKELYRQRDAGTCRECYEEAGETKEVRKREIEELKSKVNFLRLQSIGPGPVGSDCVTGPNTPSFSDVLLVASGSTDSADSECSSPSILAHRAVLASRSPVFRAMLENEMEESLSGTIKISDVSYDVLRAFVNYLYTAEACLDEHMASDLLVLAEKYQVNHLKTYCEKYLISRLSWRKSLSYYVLAHQHSAKSLLDAALSLVMDHIHKVIKQEEYTELVEKDPHVVVEIYEAYMSKRENIAASKGSNTKT